MIDFSKYTQNTLLIRCGGGLYSYELGDYKFSNYVPFEDMPLEIQERVAILLTVPEFTLIQGVGSRTPGRFFLRDD